MSKGYSTKLKIKMVQAYLTYKEPMSRLIKVSKVNRSSLKRWVYQVKYYGWNALHVRKSERSFNFNFKYKIVQYYLNHDISMKHVAVKHRINGNEVQRWVKLYRRYSKVGIRYATKRKIIMKAAKKYKKEYSSKIHSKRQYINEIVKLRKQLDNTKLERDILKAVAQLKHYKPRKNKIDCFYLD